MKTKFAIYDGRTSFCQWDVDQRIVVFDDVCDEVHIAYVGDNVALRCEIHDLDGKRVIDVPDKLLQVGKTLRVFSYVRDDYGGRTTRSEVFTVLPKPKPDDYVYTDTEMRTWESLEKRIEDLEDRNPGSVDIPTTLPNPHKLTLTGAVNAEYDGSEAVEVNIPDGGGVYTTLWQGTATDGSTITLTDSIRNYKQIIAVAGISGNAIYQFTGVFSPEHVPKVGGYKQFYLNTPFQVDTDTGLITAICTAVIIIDSETSLRFASSRTITWSSAALFAVIGVN